MFPSFWDNTIGPERQHDQAGEGFPLFPNLPAELQAMIWRHAIGEPRLFYVLSNSPDAGPVPRFYSLVMNKDYLTQASQSPGILYACRESRHQALIGTQRNVSTTNWLSILGILEFHPTAADLVYLGGLRAQGKMPPADADAIIPLCLVLGNVFSRVCVNGDIFANYFARDSQVDQAPEHPVEKGLASLRALVNTQPTDLFSDTGLPDPRLPESMVFMLDNVHLGWGIRSPCTDPAHNQPFILLPYCIHYEHLQIISDGEMDAWMDANLAQYDAEQSRRIRVETVPSIRAIWAGWRGQQDVTAQVPRLFFARIKPSRTDQQSI